MIALWRSNRAGVEASALYTDEAADSTEYAALTDTLAVLDQTYALAESSSLSSMAAALDNSLSTTSGGNTIHNPWAAYYVAQMNAYDDWSQTSAAAQSTRETTISRAQAGVDDEGNPTGGGEIGLEQAERDTLQSAADADEELALDLAGELNTIETAQANFISFGGQSQTVYPTLENANLFGDFAIEPASTDDYSVVFRQSVVGIGGTPQDPLETIFNITHTTAALAKGLPEDFWDIAEESEELALYDDPLVDEILFGAEQSELIPPAQSSPVPLISFDPNETLADLALIAALGESPSASRGPNEINLDLSQVSEDLQCATDAMLLAHSDLPQRESFDSPQLVAMDELPGLDAPPEPADDQRVGALDPNGQLVPIELTVTVQEGQLSSPTSGKTAEGNTWWIDLDTGEMKFSPTIGADNSNWFTRALRSVGAAWKNNQPIMKDPQKVHTYKFHDKILVHDDWDGTEYHRIMGQFYHRVVMNLYRAGKGVVVLNLKRN